MTAKVKITQKDDRILIESPYSDSFRRRARELGGDWTGKIWSFPARIEKEVRLALIDSYGTDGSPTPTTTLRVHLDNASLDDELRIGGVTYIKKWGRDETPRCQNGAILIKGSFCSRGGTRRYPKIKAKEGSIVEIKDIPLNLGLELSEMAGYEIADNSDEDNEQLTATETQILQLLNNLPEERKNLILSKL